MSGDDDKDIGFVEWLGFKRRPNYKNAMWLGPPVAVMLIILSAIIVISLSFQFLAALLGAGSYGGDNQDEAIRNTGLVIAALFGAPFLVWRTLVASKQTRIADEALFNNKINDAVQGLSARREITRIVEYDGKEPVLKEWEDDLVTRAAAMDRLEGLVAERKDVAPRVAKMLASYVRGNFPAVNLDPTPDLELRKTPRMDLQRAMDTIGRVYEIAASVNPREWRLDLKACDFDGVNFSKGYFRAANFSNSRFEAAILRGVNFQGCWLHGSLFNHAIFHDADLIGSKLDYITLNRPEISPGGVGIDLSSANTKGVSLMAANISAVGYLGEFEERSKIFGTKDTIVSDDVKNDMLPTRAHTQGYTKRILRGHKDLSDDDLQCIEKLESSGFQHWSPYDSSDGSTSWNHARFIEELDMKHWPYWD